MSVYNETEIWLREAITSILNQTYRDFEFIIVLDNPGNLQLENIILEYAEADKRIIFLKNEENIGLVKSLNKALKIAEGKYIARMDADDISENNRLELQHRYIEENSMDLIGCKVWLIDENSSKINKNFHIPVDSRNMKKYFKYRNVMVHPSLFLKSSILRDKGIIEYRDIPYAEDYDFICRVISAGCAVANMDKYLLKYRIRTTSVCKQNTLNQMKSYLYVKKLYRERLRKNTDSYDKNKIMGIMNSKRGLWSYKISCKFLNRSKSCQNRALSMLYFILSRICCPYILIYCINTLIFILGDSFTIGDGYSKHLKV